MEEELHEKLKNLPPDTLKRILNRLVDVVLRREDFEIPKYRFDGVEITSAGEISKLLGIPELEAKVRMARQDFPACRATDVLDVKDIYTGHTTHSVVVGVGTVRPDGVLVPRKKRRRRKRSEELDRSVTLTYSGRRLPR